MMKFNRLPPQVFRYLCWGMLLPIIALNGWVLMLILDYFQSPIRIFIIANLLAFILGYPRSVERRKKCNKIEYYR